MLTVVQRGNFLSFSKEILMGVLKAQFNAVSIHPLSDTGALQMSLCLSIRSRVTTIKIDQKKEFLLKFTTISDCKWPCQRPLRSLLSIHC